MADEERIHTVTIVTTMRGTFEIHDLNDLGRMIASCPHPARMQHPIPGRVHGRPGYGIPVPNPMFCHGCGTMREWSADE